MTRQRLALFALALYLPLLAGTPVAQAQTTVIGPGGVPMALPLRNLQIEVRQVRNGSDSRSGVLTEGSVVLQPGSSGGSVSIRAQDGQRNEGRELVQRALVLNGRSVAFNLGNSTPLRLVQSIVQNGQVRYVPGTVFIEANSGFSAAPVWLGAGTAELELAAVQSRAGRGAVTGSVSSSSASTHLTLPLNEWVLVAQSEDAFGASNNGPGGSTQASGREAVSVEVRISVR